MAAGPQRAVSQSETLSTELTCNINLLHEYTVKTLAASITPDP